MFMVQTALGAALLYIAFHAGIGIGLEPELAGWLAFGLFIVYHLHVFSAVYRARKRAFRKAKEEYRKEEERIRRLKDITKK